MKRSTVVLVLPPLVIGALVSCYWGLAFYAALTTPIWKGPGPKPPDQWEAIDGIRNHGWEALIPIWFDRSHPFLSIPFIDSLHPNAFLGLMIFLYGFAATMMSLIIWWLVLRVVKRHTAR